MSAQRPVVRAIVRDLSRTGVPIALARLLTWRGALEALDVHVVARNDGPLRAVLEQAGVAVMTLEPEHGRTLPASAAAGAAYLGRPDRGRALLATSWRRRIRRLPTPDTVLVQGAGAWPVAEALRNTDAPRVVAHLHELELALRRSVSPPELGAMAAADQVLAVSEPVAALARSIGVSDDRLAIVGGTVDLIDADRGRTDVLTIGDAGWRKGTDRAVAAAYELQRLAPGLRWHWVGRGPEPGWDYPPGTALPLAFHPSADDPWAVTDGPAALVVTSREDPLPLVALEAGARGIPVIACRGAGGLDALLADGRGWLVDPTDPRDLALCIQDVAADRSSDRPDALRAFVAAHHTLEAVGPTWLAALTGAGEPARLCA